MFKCFAFKIFTFTFDSTPAHWTWFLLQGEKATGGKAVRGERKRSCLEANCDLTAGGFYTHTATGNWQLWLDCWGGSTHTLQLATGGVSTADRQLQLASSSPLSSPYIQKINYLRSSEIRIRNTRNTKGDMRPLLKDSCWQATGSGPSLSLSCVYWSQKIPPVPQSTQFGLFPLDTVNWPSICNNKKLSISQVVWTFLKGIQKSTDYGVAGGLGHKNTILPRKRLIWCWCKKNSFNTTFNCLKTTFGSKTERQCTGHLRRQFILKTNKPTLTPFWTRPRHSCQDIAPPQQRP